MDLSAEVYRLTAGYPDHEKYGLTAETRKTVRSVPYNIAEGHRRRSTADFIRFLRIAAGSNGAGAQPSHGGVQIAYAYALRMAKTGWTPELRRKFFSWFARTAPWQGGNQFHGDATYYGQSQGLTSRNTTVAQECLGVSNCPSGGLPYHRDQWRDTTAQITGPIVRDKFWFFGSFEFQNDYDSQPGTDPAFPAKSTSRRVFYKLNYNLSDNHRIMHGYHNDYWSFPGVPSALNAPSTAIGTVNRIENGSDQLSYWAARMRNTSSIAKANTTAPWPAAFFSW